MPRPICVPCRIEMRCERNDQAVNDPAADGFLPTYWFGDRYRCDKCGHEIVTGFGQPFSPLNGPAANESIQFDYNRAVKS